MVFALSRAGAASCLLDAGNIPTGADLGAAYAGQFHESDPNRDALFEGEGGAPIMRSGARDIGARAIAFAETNVQASLDYAQSLVHARDLSEVMRLHGEYVQGQMKTLAEQASEMGQIVGRAAMDATRAKH